MFRFEGEKKQPQERTYRRVLFTAFRMQHIHLHQMNRIHILLCSHEMAQPTEWKL